VISDTLPLGSTTFSIQLGKVDLETTSTQYCIILFNNDQFFKLYSDCEVLKSGVLQDIPFSKRLRDWILWYVDMNPYGVEVTLKVLIRFFRRAPSTTTEDVIQKIMAGEKFAKKENKEEIEIERKLRKDIEQHNLFN
jgi:hypothetical protein